MPLPISNALRRKLLALREKQLQRPNADAVLLAQEVVVITLGLGPAIYLGLDGRVLIEHYMEDEPLRVTEDVADVAAALVIGAKRHGLAELYDLLPPCPAEGVVCRTCSGRHWASLDGPGAGPVDDCEATWVVCWTCQGLGWQNADATATDDGASV